MIGIYFYLQILFALLLFLAVGAALYLGVFHAHRPNAGAGYKILSSAVSGTLSFVLCFFAYSWTYLNW